MSPDVEMASESGAGADAGPQTRLAPGTKLAGGTYTVASLLGRASLGEVYRATEANGHPVAIYLFDDVVAKNPAACQRLDQQIAAVSEVEHKNVARIGAIQTEGEFAYTVNEYVDGSTLASLIESKRASGSVFTPKGAYNVIAHLCNALVQVHQRGAHGMLWPGNVIVNKAGRVKITELGLVAPGAIARGPAAAYAAPELVKQAKVTPAADVFSAGAILYELLTGVPPQANCPPPSKVSLGLPPAVDQVVATCVNPDPSARYPSVGHLKAALQQAVDSAAAAAAAAPAVAKRPSLAHQLSSEQQAQLARPSGQTAAVSDTTEKWLVSKGKLDYGPFNLQQVIAQIQKDQVLPGHVVIDNETGERTQVEKHPLLHDIVDRAKQLRDDRRRAQAEAHHVKKETRRGATLYVFIGLGVLVLGAAAYFLVTKLSAAADDEGAGAIAELKEGELQTKITFPTRKKTTRKAGGKRRGGKRGGKSGGAIGGDGFDDPLDLGDVSDGEDSERLDDSEINPVISRHGGKLGRCLSSTGTRHASVAFIIKGTGKVSAVKVNGQTGGKLADCIGRVMRNMKFPSFNGPRTKAEFDMSI